MKFRIKGNDPLSSARTGILVTDHGEVNTPAFIPVGTTGAVKGIHIMELRDDIHAQILLGNTYHLYLRPGADVVAGAGGIHRFSGWSSPVLTDSGGYQIYSMTDIRKFTEDGVVFQSHIDGSRHYFTPEKAVDIQRLIGADIMMAFDECTPYPCEYDYASASMEVTHRWLQRCMEEFDKTECPHGYTQSLFPIVQGSIYRDLRQQSAEYISSFEAPGNAIGGLSVGEPAALMYEMTDLVCQVLPKKKPRYLMGVGTPANILECIALGIDLFDCVIPTRNGRNGMLFTRNGIINIRNEKWKKDYSLLEEEGEVFTDQEYSKAYVRHLFVAKEMLGPMIATLHNLGFYIWLMAEAGRKILEGNFSHWKTFMSKQLMQRL